MGEYVSTVALILRGQNYKEADQLLTVYTSAEGKMTVLAKGVKKNTSKLRGGLQLFSQTDLTMVMGKTFPVVINAECISAFTPIRQGFDRMSYAGYVMDLLDKLITEKEANQGLFLLILQGMNLLAYIDPWVATRAIEMRLLTHLGYEVNLQACAICGKILEEGVAVRGVYGGLICSGCFEGEQVVVALEVEAITVLEAFSHMAVGQLGAVYVSHGARGQIEEYLELQLAGALLYPLKTREFLRSMGL